MNVSFSVSYISEIPPEADPSIPANIFDPTAATIYGLASEVSSNCVANSKNGVPLTTEPNPTITAVSVSYTHLKHNSTNILYQQITRITTTKTAGIILI